MDSIGRRSEKEDEYFARKEFQRRKQEMAAAQREMAEKERAEARELHFMKCPKCGMDLAEMTYSGVTVDKCTDCGGIWLDPGEYETLLNQEKEGLVGKIMGVFGQ